MAFDGIAVLTRGLEITARVIPVAVDGISVMTRGFASSDDVTGPEDAIPGTILVSSFSGTTMTLRYAPGANVDAATLYMTRHDTGEETTQSIVSGANSVTVSPGAIYRLAAAAYNSIGELGGFTNSLLVRVPSTGEGTDYAFRWKSDYDSDWQSVGLDVDARRIRVPTNRLGHHIQWEIKTANQNNRMVVRNMAMTVRMGGRAYGAQQS